MKVEDVPTTKRGKKGLKKFLVEVRRTSQEVCTVEVMAKDKEGAEDLACEKAAEDESIEWDYITDTGPEAYDVEEV